MARTRVKICGMRDLQTALAAAKAGADAIGLVFVSRSPRCLTVDDARTLVQALPAFVQPVGLFCDAPLAEVRRTAKELGLQTVQLHGRETPRFVADLAPLRVIKALSFDPRRISDTLAPWRGAIGNLAGILFDAPPANPSEQADKAAADGAAQPALTGGSGQTLDWHALAQLAHGGLLAGLPPLILAGGLRPDNVAQAIGVVRPYAVDVSSGVESRRGVKDIGLIQAFVQNVRACDATIACAQA